MTGAAYLMPTLVPTFELAVNELQRARVNSARRQPDLLLTEICYLRTLSIKGERSRTGQF